MAACHMRTVASRSAVGAGRDGRDRLRQSGIFGSSRGNFGQRFAR